MSFTPILLSSSTSYGNNTNDTPKALSRGGKHFCVLPSSLATVVLIMTTTDISIVIIPSGGSPQVPIPIAPNNGSANTAGSGSIWVDPTLDIIYVSAIEAIGDDVSYTSKYSVNVGANTVTKISSISNNAPLGTGWMYTSSPEVLINNTLAVGVTAWVDAVPNTASKTFSQNVYTYNPTATTTGTFGANSTPLKNVVSSDTNITSNANMTATVLKIGSTPYALFGMAGTNLLKLHRLTVTATTASTTVLGTYTLVSPLGMNTHNEFLADFCTDGTDIYIAYTSSTTAITIAKWNVAGATTSTIATISSLSKVTDLQMEYFNGNLWIGWSDGVTQATNLECVYATYSITGTQITARTVVAGGDALGYQGSRIGIVGSNLLYGYQKGTASPSAAYYGVLASIATAFSKSLSDSVTTSEAFSKIFVSRKSLNDSVTTSEIFSKIFLSMKSLNDSMALSESVRKASSKSQFDVITGADTISKLITKSQSDNIVMSDATISKRLAVTVTDIIATLEITGKSTPRSLNDMLSIADSVSSATSRLVNLNDSIAIVDAIGKSLRIYSNDFISASDSKSLSSVRRLSDLLSFSDITVTTRSNRIVTLSDNIPISDILAKSTSRIYLDTVVISDIILSKNSSKRIYDVVVTTDSKTLNLTVAPKLIGTIQLKGDRSLYIYLLGDRNLNIDLKGGL